MVIEAVTLSFQGLIFQHRVQQDLWQIPGHQTAKSFLAPSSLVLEREGWNAFVTAIHSGWLTSAGK